MADRSMKQKIEYFLYEDDSFKVTASKFLLGLLAMGPILIAGAAMPGLLSSAGKVKKSKKYSKSQFQNAYRNLKNRKLIEIVEEKNDKFRVRLTKEGKEKIKEFCFETLKIEKPGKWDGKWRILIFDIPSKPKIYNNAREALRRKIKELGFHQLQKSVWVHPYPCEDEILLIAEIYRVQNYIEVITAEKLLHQEKTKRIFGF